MKYKTEAGSRGICPNGWHIPTMVEIEALRPINGSGNALKAIDQGSGAGAGTNTSGFSALLAGNRSSDGTFYGLGSIADFWMGESGGAQAGDLFLHADDGDIWSSSHYIDVGLSIRCVRD